MAWKDSDPCIVLSAEDVRRMRRMDGQYVHLHPFQPDTAEPTAAADRELWISHQLKRSPAPEPGERVWVREPFYVETSPLFSEKPTVRYAADDIDHKYAWEAPLRMPKEYARIWLKCDGATLCRLFDLFERADVSLAGFQTPEIFGKYWEERTKGAPLFSWWNNPYVVVASYDLQP